MTSSDDQLIKNSLLFISVRGSGSVEERLEGVKRQVAEGADVNATDGNDGGNSVLHVAVRRGEAPIVKFLIDTGADVTSKNRNGLTPLDIARTYHAEDKEIKRILEAPKHKFTHEIEAPDPVLSTSVLRPFHPINKNEKTEAKYSKRPGTAGISGQIYEAKLLSLIALRALKDEQIDNFLLGTNINGIGHFGGICLRYRVKGRQRPVMLFVQVKYRDDTEKGKLTIKDVQSTSGDFSLRKYFESYLTIKERFRADTEDPMFEGDFDDVECNLVVHTSAENCVAKKPNERKQKVSEKVDFLLNTKPDTEPFQYDYDEECIDFLTKTTVIEKLKKLGVVFLEFIMSEKYKIALSDKLISRYHVVIARKVLRQSRIQETNKDFRCWEFRSDFFKSECEYLVALKRTFINEISMKRCDGSNISEQDHKNITLVLNNPCAFTINKLIGKLVTYNDKTKKLKLVKALAQQMKSDDFQTLIERFNDIVINQNVIDEAVQIKLSLMKIKLPSSFGNLDMTFRGNDVKIRKRIKYLADKVMTLLNMNETKINDTRVVEITTLEQGIISANGGLCSAVGNLLVLDTDTKMLKFDLSNDVLPKYAALFLNELNDSKYKPINEKLNDYRIRIKIDGFPIYSFEEDEYDKQQAKDFLNKLWIYNEHAKLDEVEQMLKHDIQKYFTNKNKIYEEKAPIEPRASKIIDWENYVRTAMMKMMDEIKSIALKKKKQENPMRTAMMYEINLLTLIFLRALNDNEIEDFLLGSNISGIGDMDDVCLRFQVRGQQRPIVLFMQARHRENTEKMRLSVKDFNLQKYFNSYLTIKERFTTDTKDPFFEGDFGDVECNLVIYTPVKDCAIKKKTNRKINEKVHCLINTGKKSEVFQCDYDEESIDYLTNMTVLEELKSLGEFFLEFVLHNKFKPEAIFLNKLLARYHVIMAQQVLEIHEENKEFRCWKFRPEFFKSECEYLVALRNAFFKVMTTKLWYQSTFVNREDIKLFLENPCPATVSKLIGVLITYNYITKEFQLLHHSTSTTQKYEDRKLLNLLSNAINENMVTEALQFKLLSMRIILPLAFGNLDMTFRGNESKVLKRIKYLANRVLNLLMMNKETKIVEINDDNIGPGKAIEQGIMHVNGGIGSAVGNLLVLDTYTNMLKFDLNNEALPNNAALFLHELNDQQLLSENLGRYRFRVNIKEFPKICFNGDEHKQLAKSFFSELWFYCNQAKQDEVEQIVKHDFDKYYNEQNDANKIQFNIERHDIFLEVLNEIQNWWMCSSDVPYLNRQNDFFERAKHTCLKYILLNINTLHKLGSLKSTSTTLHTQVIDQAFWTLFSKLSRVFDTSNTSFNIDTEMKNQISKQLLLTYYYWRKNYVMQREPKQENVATYVYKKRAGTWALRSHMYETKLLCLILLRSLNDKQIKDFCLGYKIQDIGVMNNICLRYREKDHQRPVALFLQIKHVENLEKTTLTVEDMRSATGKFSLLKYFDSYLKIKDRFRPDAEDPLFQGKFDDVDCKLVLYTPAKDCLTRKKAVPRVDKNLVYILNTGQNIANVFQYDTDGAEIDYLTTMSVTQQIKELGLVFFKLIMSGKHHSDVISANELLAKYHVVLGREVLEQCTQKTYQNVRLWRFRPEFFINDNEYLVILRKTLVKILSTKRWDQSKITDEDLQNIRHFSYYQPASGFSKLLGKLVTYNDKTRKLHLADHSALKENLSETLQERINEIEIDEDIVNETIRTILLSMKIKLPLSFGNVDMYFKGSEALVQSKMDQLANAIIKLTDRVELLKDRTIIVINEEDNTLNSVIGSAVGNLLILDTETKMLMFDLNNKALPDKAQLFLEKLKDKLVNVELNKYRIKVNTKMFPKYSFEIDEYEKRQAEEFLSKLWFYTSQAREDEVDLILIDEIFKNYDIKITSGKANLGGKQLHTRLHDDKQWSIQTSESPYLTKFTLLIKHGQLADFDNLLISVINYMYISNIHSISWTVNLQNKKDDNFGKMCHIFSEISGSLFRIFNPEFRAKIPIDPPPFSYLFEMREVAFDLKIHPKMEAVYLKMAIICKSGRDCYELATKVGPTGGIIVRTSSEMSSWVQKSLGENSWYYTF